MSLHLVEEGLTMRRPSYMYNFQRNAQCKLQVKPTGLYVCSFITSSISCFLKMLLFGFLLPARAVMKYPGTFLRRSLMHYRNAQPPLTSSSLTHIVYVKNNIKNTFNIPYQSWYQTHTTSVSFIPHKLLHEWISRSYRTIQSWPKKFRQDKKSCW